MIASVNNFFDLYLEAGNPETSRERLAELAANRDPRIRKRVAENESTSIETLSILMKDCEPDVLIALSSNKNLPVCFLEELASDCDPTVRLGLAQELNCPRSILSKLANDENPFVRHEATKTLAALGISKLSHIDKFSMKKLQARKIERAFRRA